MVLFGQSGACQITVHTDKKEINKVTEERKSPVAITLEILNLGDKFCCQTIFKISL